MKVDFRKYLESISLSQVMLDKAIENYKALTIVSNIENFDEIFFSEMKSKNGPREYFSLWGFTETMFCKITIGKTADAENKVVLFKSRENVARFVINEYN